MEMEKILATMPDGGAPITASRVLELNPQHAVFAALKAAQADGNEEKVKSYAGLLYNQALLVEGMPIDDPIAFAREIANLMR